MNKFIFEDVNGVPFGTTDDKQLNSGLIYGFSTRIGGVSEGSLESLNLGVNRPDTAENLKKNYKIFCRAVGIEAEKVVVAHQVHSDIIMEVSENTKWGRLNFLEQSPDCDGLLATDKNVALAIFYADCTPVLLFDTEKKVLCLVHCGWRGTVKGFAETGVITMVNNAGAKMGNIHAVIGPCIGKCCFEVGEEVKEEFSKAKLEKYISAKEGKYFADLKGANYEMLLRAGLEPENITVSEECTMCNTNKYFSHRGCGAQTGRMALIACIR